MEETLQRSGPRLDEALLLAPRTGAETRRRITGALDDTKEAASRMPLAIREASSAAQAAFAAAP